jgi:hypothetical protein
MLQKVYEDENQFQLKVCRKEILEGKKKKNIMMTLVPREKRENILAHKFHAPDAGKYRVKDTLIKP